MQGLELIGAGTSFDDTLFDMVADAAMFADFRNDEIRQLIRFMHAYRADTGADIFCEGQSGGFLGLLIDGRVDVLKQDAEGVTKKIAAISPGKTFGEMSLLDGLPCSATARAQTACTVVLLTKENFRKLVEQHPATGVKLLWELGRLISLRLRQTSGQLVDVLGNE